MRQLKKKVIVVDEKSSPLARANRLKRLRHMANLSREKMCDDGTINVNTYKGWEVARYGGLPIDGAEKVIARIAKEGIICSVEWLIYEIGSGPFINQNFQTIQQTKTTNTDDFGNVVEYMVSDSGSTIIKNSLPQKSYGNFVINEILLFKKQFSNVIHCKIVDDGLSPNYNIGDYVAGIKYSGHHIHKAINQDCIVQLPTGETLVRYLRLGTKPNHYMLVCTNHRTSVKKPILYDVELSCIAPISRVYKNNS